MSTIVTRAGKGSALTHAEVDANFTNLNTDKVEGQSSSVDSEIALFSGTGGKTIKRATTTGVLKATSGVISAAVAGTDYAGVSTANTFTNNQVISVNSATDALRITQTGTGNALLVEDSTNPDSSPFVIDASGRLLVGLTSTNTAFGGKLQVEGTSDAFASLVRYSSSALANPAFYFGRSKSATLGTNTIVASGDALGAIVWAGANGTGYSDAASIQGLVDGTPGASADMPGCLVFSTSADGSATPTERMRIDSSGNLGIGTTSPIYDLQVGSYGVDADSTLALASTTTGTGSIRFGDGTAGVAANAGRIQYDHNVNAMTFSTLDGSERLRIDSSGRLLVGATAINTLASTTGLLQLETANSATNLTIIRNTANASSPIFAFGKSRGAAAGGRTVVSSGDFLGVMLFTGADGTNMVESASINAAVDGTPGTNAMPGRLVFSTTRGGTFTISTVSRATNVVTLVATANINAIVGDTIVVSGVTDTTFNGTFTISTVSGATITYAQTAANASSSSGTVVVQVTSSTERMRIDSSGNLGIGTTSPSVSGLDVSRATGSATPTPVELRLATTTSASDWSTTDPWGRISFYSADASSAGAKVQAAIQTVAIGTPGGTSSFDFLVTDNANGTLFKAISLQPAGTNTTQTIFYSGGGTERMRIDSFGNVGIGTSSPTALITIAAGTATANTAPLKFTSGVNLTTPEAGVVEYDGTIMTATSNTNFKRGAIPLTNYTSGTGTNLGVNTETTLQNLLPAANDTITLSSGTYFVDIAFNVTRTGNSTTSATARLNLLGGGGAAGNFSGMSLSAPTAGGATANFSFSAVNINVSNVLTAASTTSGGVYTMTLRGVMKITSGGTIVPQYNLSATLGTGAAGGASVSVLYFRLQQIDTQSAAAFGPVGTGWG